MAINIQNVERFKFIAHKIIPLVYDDSLSYYEFLCKVMQKLNEVISSLDNQNEILEAFDEEILDWETSTDNKYNQFVSNINTLFEAFKQSEVAARTAFMDALIGSYNASTHYAVGQYVRYGNNVYKCTTATSGEAWNPAHWTQVVYADDLSERQSDYEESITAQQNGFETEITGQQTMFEQNITQQQNEFESSMQAQWDEFFDQYLETLGVVQTTGTSTTDVMSQKAVTDEFDKIIKEDIDPIRDHTKNIFEGEFVQGNIDSSGNDTETLKEYFVRTADYIPVDTSIVQEDNQCYIMISFYSLMNSYNVCYYDTTKTFISRSTGKVAAEIPGRKSKFFVVPTAAKYIRVAISGGSGTTQYTPADVTQAQIEYGYELTDYEYPWTAYDKTARSAVTLKLDSSAVKQALGTSTTDVMSQNAVTSELASKLDNSAVKQALGTSSTDVMSQNAVTSLYKKVIKETKYAYRNAICVYPTNDILVNVEITNPPYETVTSTIVHRNKNLASYANSASISENTTTYFAINIIMQKGEWYTISYKQAEAITSAIHNEVRVNIDNASYYAPKNLSAGTIVFKFQSPITANANVGIYTAGLSNTINISEFMIECGDEATSYVEPQVENMTFSLTPSTEFYDTSFTPYDGANYISFTPTYGYLTVTARETVKVIQDKITEKPINWSVACGDIICVGDSLTDGLYAPISEGKIKQNYPYYLGRLLNATVTNAGLSGGYPSEFYTERYSSYDFSDYDTVFIWLGTNGGMSIDDINTPGTQANYYKLIIDGIKTQKPDIRIILGTVFVTGAIHTETTYPNANDTNKVIKYFANLYNLPCIDFSDLTAAGTPLLHNMQNNTHFGKTGNIYIANRITNYLKVYFEEDISRCEFGILPKPTT